MDIRERVLKETENASDFVLSEVLDYFHYLKAKHQQQNSIPEKFVFDPQATPIWELVSQISAQIPDEEWQKLPTDLARRFDNYQQQRQG
jgi:hypothetical protein